MLSKRTHTLAFFFLVVVAIFILDSITKQYAVTHFSTHKLTPFAPPLISFLLVFNRGAAFSFGEGLQSIFILLFFAVFLASFIFLFLHPKAPVVLVLGLACMCGGGLGNALDRILAQHVVDFIHIDFIQFPVCNVADIALTFGFVFVLLSFIHTYVRRAKE